MLKCRLEKTNILLKKKKDKRKKKAMIKIVWGTSILIRTAYTQFL